MGKIKISNNHMKELTSNIDSMKTFMNVQRILLQLEQTNKGFPELSLMNLAFS